ncbi:MAG: hypothetical protein JSR98_15250 [Proteobacteria bacterium]|nr:hypothetical protein [Pseudomonadota bacterium]
MADGSTQPPHRIDHETLASMILETGHMERAIAIHDRWLALQGEIATRGLQLEDCCITMGEKAAIIARRHGYTLADLRHTRGRHAQAWVRWEIMHKLYETRLADGRRRWSKPMIGRFFGMDHSSVWHGIRRWRDRMVFEAVREWCDGCPGGRYDEDRAAVGDA